MCNSSLPYQHTLLIPFHLADPAGILFFGHVFTLAHQTFESFILEELQLNWKDWFQNQEWIVPIKHTEASYFAPLIAGQPCTIECSIEKIGQTSFQSHYHFKQKQVDCCHVNLVHIFCNKTTRQKQPIPDMIRSLLILCEN